MGNKTRNSALGLVLQQFVARFTFPFLASFLKREFLELGNGPIIACDHALPPPKKTPPDRGLR